MRSPKLAADLATRSSPGSTASWAKWTVLCCIRNLDGCVWLEWMTAVVTLP